MTTVDIIKPFFFIVFLLIEIKPLSKTLSLNLFFLFCSVQARVWLLGVGANFNATFPFPQVFSLLPFPLKREPTTTAWRGTTLSTRINKCRSLIMPPRFVRRLRNNMAQSLVLIVKLGVRYGRRLAAPNPSSKSHIPFISTPRIGFPFVAKGRFYAKKSSLWQRQSAFRAQTRATLDLFRC